MKKAFKIIERGFMIIAVVIVASAAVRAVDNYLGERVETSGQGEGACGRNMVSVASPDGDFCIDMYEASPAEECPYKGPGNQADSRLNIESEGCRPVSEPGGEPWRFISQNQAALACAKAGKRLPTNKEWMLAAFGTPDKESNWGKDDCQVNANWDEQPGKSGAGRNCRSAAGAYDMIGNVWEWVDGTVFDGRFDERELPPDGYILGVDTDGLPTETDFDKADPNYFHDYFWLKRDGARSMARGGYWDNESDAGQYSLYAVSPPSYAGTGVGFRCAK